MTRRSRTVAEAAAVITKKLLGATVAAPRTVNMPKAVHELHVSSEEVIPAGTVITDELAELAGLGELDLQDLLDSGACTLVEVLATAAAETVEG